MINLIRLLSLTSDAEPESIADALRVARQQGGEDAEIDGVSVDRLSGVLGNATRHTHYRRVHDQYTAIARAIELLDLPGTADSHRWRERTIEYLD